MNKGLTAFLAFAGGAGISALVTWVLTKKYYQEKVNQALIKIHENAEKENLQQKARSDEDKSPEVQIVTAQNVSEPIEAISLENSFQKQAAKVAQEKTNQVNYTKMLKELNYTPHAEEDEDDDYISEYPYLITPEMPPYGQKEDSDGNPYTKITLMYYEDGVIADTADEIIDDVDDVIGSESLRHFGDYPNKDCIYVRNDRMHADFEVCMSKLTWEGDILSMKPYLRS